MLSLSIGGKDLNNFNCLKTSIINIYKFFFSCGGSIIDKNWILSAGHCCAAIKRRNNNGVVVVGSIDLRSRDGIDEFR